MSSHGTQLRINITPRDIKQVDKAKLTLSGSITNTLLSLVREVFQYQYNVFSPILRECVECGQNIRISLLECILCTLLRFVHCYFHNKTLVHPFHTHTQSKTLVHPFHTHTYSPYFMLLGMLGFLAHNLIFQLLEELFKPRE